jgi:hypothetical protein
MRLPKLKYWYHATTVDRAEKILQDGCIKAAWVDGIYLANTNPYAGGFVRMRGHSEWAVFKIPRSRLDVKKIAVSDDHNPRFFPKDLIAVRYLDQEISVSTQDVEFYEDAE